MYYRICTALLLAVSAPVLVASTVEKISNPKVLVTEDTLAPGESEQLPARFPSMVVYMAAGTVQTGTDAAHRQTDPVSPGETLFQPAAVGTLRNAGNVPLHFVRIEFLTSGSQQTWGMTGLSPHYKMLLEDQYARAYDIKIPAHTYEPLHTHHDRVVVSLSGAQLEHILPSGQIQPSTLKTGEVVWRLGATHIGHNLGDTDLWVIAVEPK